MRRDFSQEGDIFWPQGELKGEMTNRVPTIHLGVKSVKVGGWGGSVVGVDKKLDKIQI